MDKDVSSACSANSAYYKGVRTIRNYQSGLSGPERRAFFIVSLAYFLPQLLQGLRAAATELCHYAYDRRCRLRKKSQLDLKTHIIGHPDYCRQRSGVGAHVGFVMLQHRFTDLSVHIPRIQQRSPDKSMVETKHFFFLVDHRVLLVVEPETHLFKTPRIAVNENHFPDIVQQ